MKLNKTFEQKFERVKKQAVLFKTELSAVSLVALASVAILATNCSMTSSTQKTEVAATPAKVETVEAPAVVVATPPPAVAAEAKFVLKLDTQLSQAIVFENGVSGLTGASKKQLQAVAASVQPNDQVKFKGWAGVNPQKDVEGQLWLAERRATNAKSAYIKIGGKEEQVEVVDPTLYIGKEKLPANPMAVEVLVLKSVKE